MKSPKRPRCAQCRKPFEFHPAAHGVQRVCGSVCRALRDNTLARGRRAQHLDEVREDERLRQQKHRAAVRAAGSAPERPPERPCCHAPPSDDKALKLRWKVIAIVEEEASLSRARLTRRLAKILDDTESCLGTEPPVSRTTLSAPNPILGGFP